MINIFRKKKRPVSVFGDTDVGRVRSANQASVVVRAGDDAPQPHSSLFSLLS